MKDAARQIQRYSLNKAVILDGHWTSIKQIYEQDKECEVKNQIKNELQQCDQNCGLTNSPVIAALLLASFQAQYRTGSYIPPISAWSPTKRPLLEYTSGRYQTYQPHFQPFQSG